MNKIRIHNDIRLSWAIYRTSQTGDFLEDFTDADIIEMYIHDKTNTFRYYPAYTVLDGTFRMEFPADRQKVLGEHILFLQYKKDGDTYTIDSCDAFELVDESCKQSIDNTDKSGVIIDSVALTSKVDLLPMVIGNPEITSKDYNELENLPLLDSQPLKGDALDTYFAKYSANVSKAIASVDEDQNNIIVEKTFADAATLSAWLFIESNQRRVRQGSIFRFSSDEPDFIADWDGNKYTITPLLQKDAYKDLSNVSDEDFKEKALPLLQNVSSQIASASSSVYSSAVAYVDSQTKDFEYLQLYINPTDISTVQPTGAGVSIPLNMTTTEQLWFDKSFTIQSDGVVDKNIYKLLLPFSSVSTSRVTICRAVWSVTTQGTENIIFDKEFILQNTTGDYDFSGDFIREYPTDILYKAGDTARLKLYGRVSTGTDIANVLLGDSNRTALLVRANPISQGVTKSYVDNAIQEAVGGGGTSSPSPQRKNVIFTGTSETVNPKLTCTTTAASLFIPQNIVVTVEGTTPYRTTADATLALTGSRGYGWNVFFDNKAKTFSAYNTLDTPNPTLSSDVAYVGFVYDQNVFGARGDLRVNSPYWSINGSLYSFKPMDKTTEQLLTQSFKYIPSLSANEYIVVQGLRNFKITSREYKYTYKLVAVKSAITTNDMFIMFSYDKNGVRGQDLRLGTTHFTYVTDTMWFVNMDVNGDKVFIMYDHKPVIDAGITYVDTASNLIVSYANYVLSTSDYPGRKYCNLGASTSGMTWHSNAVKALGMDWKSFNVGSAKWMCEDGYALNYSDTPPTKDNSIMNQIARLFKFNADTGYVPDVVHFMCGLTDSSLVNNSAYSIGTLIDALVVDPSEHSPTDWATSPEAWRKNVSITVRCALYYISMKFPYATILLSTVQDNKAGYPVDNIILINSRMTDICKRLATPVIDIFGNSGWSSLLGTIDIFTDDGVHPNAAGTLELTNFMKKALNNTLYFRK